MPSVMAIVSKAVFEKEARGLTVGQVWATDRYASANRGLAPLEQGGDLYLVTVRPPDEALWLVAVLSAPRFASTEWRAKANVSPIRDISALKGTLKFANGAGLPAKAGALGMSLQTPRVLTAGDLGQLGKSVDAKPTASPAKQAAKPAAKQSTKPAAKQNPKAGGDPFAVALAAIRENRRGEALVALVDAWRSHPSARLAEVVMTVSEATRAMMPGIAGKTQQALARWTALAGPAAVAEIPGLLDTLADCSSGDAVERLALVERWMPDPRVDAALAGLFESVPYRATMTKPFWKQVFALVREIRDPRQRARLEAADARIKADVAATMAAWLREQLAKALGELRPTLADDAPAPPIVDEIAAAFAATPEGRSDLDELLRAVYDAPDDDALRLVYADALIERNDPRGELITLQCRLAKEPDHRELRRREKELLDENGRQWLGELAPIVMAGFRFERGFLAECRTDRKKPDRVRELAGHPSWSTVRVFDGPALIALHPVMRSLRVLSFESDDADNGRSWRDLLVETERPLEELRYRGLHRERRWEEAIAPSVAPSISPSVEGGRAAQPDVLGRWIDVARTDEIVALCRCAALPELRRLSLRGEPALVAAAILASPVLARLDEIGFAFDSRDMQQPLALFAPAWKSAPVATMRFELEHAGFHPTEFRLERGARGYERLVMEVGPTTSSNWSETLVQEAIYILDILPPTIRELRITTRRQTDPKHVARLKAAAHQKHAEICDVA